MSRPKKKPDYSNNDLKAKLAEEVLDAYKESGTISQVAAKFHMTPLKIRKILITADAFSSERSEEVQRLYKEGFTVLQIMSCTGLGRASVQSYLPYTKTVYKMEELSVNADRIGLYRRRKAAVAELAKELDKERNGMRKETYDAGRMMTVLWNTLELFQGYSFQTVKGLKYTYYIKEGEIFFSRKEKSVTRASVEMAAKKAVELGRKVSGPKKLGVFGASYLYPVFMKIGLVEESISQPE